MVSNSPQITRGCLHRLWATYDGWGPFYFEMWIRTPASGKTACDLATHIRHRKKVYEHYEREKPSLLAGVEIKDWKDPVPRSVVMDEFEGYRHQFDLFYFAANQFGPSALDIEKKHLGLIDISKGFSIIEPAHIQPTIASNRGDFIEALERNWRRNHERIQRTHPWAAAIVNGETVSSARVEDGQTTLAAGGFTEGEEAGGAE